jgi:hypothetical protein
MQSTRRFARTVGIDYSGAQTPTASLPGLRVYPAEVPAPSPRKYWTRRDGSPVLIGS